MKLFTILFLSLVSINLMAAPSTNDRIYCIEDGVEDAPAWELRYTNGSITTKGYVITLDSRESIELTQALTNKPSKWPYGYYSGEVNGKPFNFDIYGRNYFTNDYIARFWFENDYHLVNCYTAPNKD